MKIRKPHRIKRKKPIYKNRFFWISILVLISIVSLFYFFIFSSTFQIERIKILGDNKTDPEQIKAVVNKKLPKKLLFWKTESIFVVDLNRIRKELLNKFPRIAKVIIDRDFPDRLEFEITERKPIGTFLYQNQKFLIDNQGVIFAKQSSDFDFSIRNLDFNKNPSLGTTVINKEKVSKALEVKSRCEQNLNLSLQEIVISDQRLNAETTEGWKAYFSLEKDIDWQLTKLSLVLDKKIASERKNLHYIDLRFDKVYYK